MDSEQGLSQIDADIVGQGFIVICLDYASHCSDPNVLMFIVVAHDCRD
jgi:hypothetical protein